MLSEAQLNRRGLLKLMLKMPRLRDRLKELGATNQDFLALCGAFEEASSTLERLERDLQRNQETRHEYAQLCSELESEIRTICER